MKLLILHASAGAGHKRAAEALAKAFDAARLPADVTVRDILDFTPPLFRRTYARGYLDLVRRAPEVWGYVYARTDRKAQVPWRRKVRAAFNRINAPLFLRYVRDLNPDAIVCTHFMPLELISTAKRKGRVDTPLYCVVTDFAVHALWVVDGVNGYYVATEEARQHLLRQGIGAEQVSLAGIPIDPVFGLKPGGAASRVRLGIDPRLPVVLVLSGGFGVGPAVDLIRSFRDSDVRCQLIVVAGANESLRQQAAEAALEIRQPVKVYGFVNTMHALMDAADVVVTKPGGLTSSEALAKGLPMLIVDPIPGQEQRNAEHLLESGAALRLFDIHDAPWKVKSMLEDPSRLAEMRRRATALGRPAAATEIARDIARRGA